MSALTRLLDVRPGEWGFVARAFAVLLFLVAGITALEAARDALLLSKMGPTALGAAYLTIAVFAIPTGALAGRLTARTGIRAGLLGAIGAAVGLAVFFFALPATASASFALYVTTALIGAVVIPQFWVLAGRLFTVSQGRRLLAPIATAGMLGGVVGSSLGAAVLLFAPVKSLLIVAALSFAAAGVAAAGARMKDAGRGATVEPRIIPPGTLAAFREEPFLRRIALLVILSTATLLTVDYLFKWTVARTVPAAELGTFFARTQVVLNVLSLLVQVLAGAAVVKRLGVAAAAGITPLLVLAGSVGALAFGGALLAVLVLKGIDGSLRHSIHRITSELLYFPLGRATREQVKPFIDGAGARAAQAVAAATLIALGAAGVLSPLLLCAMAVGLALTWLVVASSVRRAYLAALRRTLVSGALDEDPALVEELDLASVEVLVERMASREPAEVVAALRVLSRRGRERWIPALVLYHPDPRVLVEALRIFAASPRTDWLPLAELLREHSAESVRVAVSQALARSGHPELVTGFSADPSPRLHSYASLFLALRESPEAVRSHPALAAHLDADPPSTEVVIGLLEALADAAPSPQLVETSLELMTIARAHSSSELDDAVAHAAARQADPRLVPELLNRLLRRSGREEVRQALAAVGKPAAEAVAAALADLDKGRELRKHLPRTLARFGTQHAADVLLRAVTADPDGLVRFNALRGLGRLVVEHPVRIDRRTVEQIALRNVVEHLRLDGLLGAIGEPDAAATGPGTSIGRLLTGLLDDKRNQALERVFRLLKIAHRTEDLERVHFAVHSGDARARANAAEFLDTLLGRPDQQRLRALLRLATDDLDSLERQLRAGSELGGTMPRTSTAALVALMDDADSTLASLATSYAASLGNPDLIVAARRTYLLRPALEETMLDLLGTTPAVVEASHA